MESKHARADGDANAAGATLDLETIAIFSNLLHLHNNISGARWRERQVGSCGAICALFTLDLPVELVNQRRSAFCWWVDLILVLEFGSDIFAKVLLHGQRTQLEGHALVKQISVRDTGKDPGDTLLQVDLVNVKVLTSAVNGLEAEGFNRSAGSRVQLAESLQDISDNGTSIVPLALEEVEQVAADVLVQGNAVLVLAVQLGCRVLLGMQGEGDGGEGLEIIGVYILKIGLEGGEEVLGVLGIVLRDKFQPRVHEYGPQKLVQLELEGVSET